MQSRSRGLHLRDFCNLLAALLVLVDTKLLCSFSQGPAVPAGSKSHES